jgi:hypothetical protein
LLGPTNHAEDQEKGSAHEEQKEPIIGTKVVVKFQIFSHFIKGKIFLTPMEIMLFIPRE